MKHLYLLLFIVGIYSLSSQQAPTAVPAEELQVRLHPNPALSNTVYVVSDVPGPKQVSVFDLFGKAVLERRLTGDALPIDGLAPGVYMVRVRQFDRVAVKKLVVR